MHGKVPSVMSHKTSPLSVSDAISAATALFYLKPKLEIT